MTPEDKAYYSDGYQPLFNLMVNEWNLHLLESEMAEIMNCVRKMDESRKPQEDKDEVEQLVKSVGMGLYGADLIQPMSDNFYKAIKKKFDDRK